MGDRTQVAIVKKPRRSDATFWRDGTQTDLAYWGEWQARRWKRAGWKKWSEWAGFVLVSGTVGAGMLDRPAATERVTAAACGLVLAALLIRGLFRWEQWGHYRARVRPLALALAPVLDQPPDRAQSWVHIPADYKTREDAEVVIDVPDGFTAGGRDMEDITRAVTTKLGLLAPKVTPALDSRHPRLIYARSQPPPLSVTFRDIRNAVYGAKPSQVVLGFGPPVAGKLQPEIIDLDSETPMVAASMTTGDGKSALARGFMAQLAYHGAVIVVLDYKWFSHMQLDGLPMVSYARTAEEIHQVLCWLGHDERDADGNIIRESELTRRKRVGLASADMHGNVAADVGDRIAILSEEGNSTAKALRRYWRSIGGKGTSPALEALDEIGATGRQLRVNVLYIAQRLSAKASGSDGSADARENIGAIITKDPTEATWNMLAAGHAQPPASGHKGRYQLITRKEVREFQGAWWTPEEAREFATSGTVAVPRFDMPLVPRRDLVSAGVRQDAFARQEAPEQAFVVGHEDPVLPAGKGPAGAVTLAEAVAAGLFVSKQAARKLPKRHGWEPVEEDPAGGHKYALADIHAYLKTKGKR